MKYTLILLLVLCLPELAQSQNKRNEALVNKYLNVWNTGKVETLSTICDPNFERTGSGQAATSQLESLSLQIKRSRDNMRRYKITAENWVSNRDNVAVHWTATYWAEEDKMVKWEGVSMFKILENKLIEELVISDREPLYRQLGYKIVPPE